MKKVAIRNGYGPKAPDIYVNLDEVKITNFGIASQLGTSPLVCHYLSISEVKQYPQYGRNIKTLIDAKVAQPYITSLKSLLAEDSRKIYKEVDVNIIDADKGIMEIKEILDGNINEYLIQATPFTVTCLKENKIKYGPLIIINKSNGLVKLSSPFDDNIKGLALYPALHCRDLGMVNLGYEQYGWTNSGGAFIKDSSFGDINSDGYIIDGNFLTKSIISYLEKDIRHLHPVPRNPNDHGFYTQRKQEIIKGRIDDIDYIFTQDIIKTLGEFIMKMTKIEEIYNNDIKLLKDNIIKLELELETKKENINKSILSSKQQSINNEMKGLTQNIVALVIKLNIEDSQYITITKELLTLCSKSLQIADDFQEFSNMLELTTDTQIDLLGTDITSDSDLYH